MFLGQDTNIDYNFFVNTLNRLVSDSCKVSSSTNSKPKLNLKLPWMTAALKQKLAMKNKLYKLYLFLRPLNPTDPLSEACLSALSRYKY